MFIDTHTHLYEESLASDENQVKRAIDAGVQKMFMPNCFSLTIPLMLGIEQKWPNNCFSMMGLHPTYVKENYREELAIISEWLAKSKFWAVGEVGLDYYWDLTYRDEQKIAFEEQIDLALKYNLPVIIHSRESIADCMEIVGYKQNGRLKGIFHCFSGTLEDAQKIITLGFYLGIGGVVTYKKSTLPDILKEIPLQYIVLETDAPYLAPAPYRGKRNESSYIPIIAAKIAEIKGLSIEEIAAITTKNAENIFNIPQK